MITKTPIKRNQRIIVKTRADAGGSWKVREGKVVDAKGSCLLIEVSLFPGTAFFTRRQWFDVKDNGPLQDVRP